MDHKVAPTTEKSTRSSASTDQDDTEPLEILQPKLTELCQSIGLGVPNSVAELACGSFNRVISLAFDGEDDPEYVIRIPHYPLEDEVDTIKDQVTLLNHLAQRLPVARVIAYDAGIDNPIRSQYTVQTRIPGLPVAEVYGALPYEERLQFVDRVVAIVSKIESIRFESAGRLVAPANFPETSSKAPTLGSAVQLMPFRLGLIGTSAEVPLSAAVSLKDLMFTMIDAWALEDAFAPPFSGLQAKWKNLRRVAEEMLAMGMLESNIDENLLWHWDLAAQNILIEKQDAVWTVTGIIDWDSAISVPRVLSRRPPKWLWRFHDDPTGWDGNYDDLPPRELTDEESSIKRRFDRGMLQVPHGGDKHMNEAYGEGVWVRRLSRFALKGFGDSQDWKRYEVFVREWGQFTEARTH